MKTILQEQRRSSVIVALITMVLGAVLVVWPDRSVRLMCTLLGAALLICGLVYILGWLVRRREGGISAFTLIPGVVLSGLGCSGVKLIHGYGSSGAGGRIRVEARRRLDRMKAGGEIWGYIPGESFSIFDSDTLAAFQRCPTLRRDRDLERHNNGVTFVLL